MHSSGVLILSLALRALPVLSLAHPGPKTTDSTSDIPSSVGWTPKPTKAPFANSPLELHRRQSSAPINACGWVNGNAANPYSCNDGYACSTNFIGLYFGCCRTDTDSNFLAGDCASIATPTSCYDYTSAASCTGACYSPNIVCEYSYPYCVVATMNVSSTILTNYGCSTGPYVLTQDIETTVLYISSLASDTGATTSVSVNGNFITTSSTPSTTTSLTGSSTTITTSDNPSSTSPISPSTGHTAAIAGGVVGGLAGLAMVLGGVIFWLHKRKQREKKVIAPEISQTMYM